MYEKIQKKYSSIIDLLRKLMLNIIMFTKLAESVGRHCTNIVLAEPRPIAIIFYINFKVSTFNLTFNNDVYIFFK